MNGLRPAWVRAVREELWWRRAPADEQLGRHRGGAKRRGDGTLELFAGPQLPALVLWPHEGSAAAALIQAVSHWRTAAEAGDPAVLPSGLAALGAAWPTTPPRTGRVTSIVARRLAAVSAALTTGSLVPDDGRRAMSSLVSQLDRYWADRSALPSECAPSMDAIARSTAGRRFGPAQMVAVVLLEHWGACERSRADDLDQPLLQLEIDDFWNAVPPAGRPGPEQGLQLQELGRRIDLLLRRRAAETRVDGQRLERDLLQLVASLSGDV